MNQTFDAKIWVLGDDIDTDIILPTEYLALKTVDDMKPYAFSPLRHSDKAFQGSLYPKISLAECEVLS